MSIILTYCSSRETRRGDGHLARAELSLYCKVNDFFFNGRDNQGQKKLYLILPPLCRASTSQLKKQRTAVRNDMAIAD